MKNNGIVTLFYKSISVLDAAVLDPFLGLVGQSWQVDVNLTGHTDKEGVIADFSKIKNKIKKIIDNQVDHRLLIDHTLLNVVENKAKVNFQYGSNKTYQLEYVAPTEAFCILPNGHSTSALQVYIASIIKKEMSDNIKDVEIILREELHENIFHYTHGLKEHYGNCQRLFHGHRNTLEIWRNGTRETNWEKNLTQEIFKGNIHFAFWDNIVNSLQLQELSGKKQEIICGILDSDVMIELKYQGSQGEFWAKIPAKQTYILPCETTIENLSTYFAQWIKNNWASPTDKVTVVGYEGISKGAKAIAL